MFTIKYRYLFIVLLALYSYANIQFSEVARYYPIPPAPLGIVLSFLVITTLIWEGNRLTNRVLQGTIPVIQRGIPVNQPVRMLIAHFVISIIFSAVISATVAYFFATYYYHLTPSYLPIIIKLSITLGTRINLFLHVINTIFFYSGRLKAKEIETEALKRANAQAQLQAIKNQLNPHFLFNNLNVLSALILKERPEANAFIEEFSIVYRHILNTQDQEMVPLEKELEFIHHYLFLLQQRFPQSLRVQVDVPPAFQTRFIVPVALQLLIENAIKHNVLSTSHPLTITIGVDSERRLIVANNLQPKIPIEESTQIGLNNIAQRYALINRQRININKTETMFSVSLPLIEHLP